MNAPAGARYPETFRDRDGWIRSRRGPRNRVDPGEAYGAFVEEERTEDGEIVPVATLLLTNRECPWRCLMCDLWRNTLEVDTAPGAIPRQIAGALDRLPSARRIKLYNSGSLFDPRAVPPEDDSEIARLVSGFDRVIVESHPALVGRRCLDFHGRLGGRLEVAMGLETVHPRVLPRLNKGMTLDEFDRAADRLATAQIPMRAFVLAGLPWVAAAEQRDWSLQAVAHAFDQGATAVSVVLTRADNGAMESLRDAGEFQTPSIGLLEDVVDAGVGLGRERVFADLWDLPAFSKCASCLPSRTARLAMLNRTQSATRLIRCDSCGDDARS